MAVTMEIRARVPESAGGMPEKKRGRGRKCQGLYAKKRRRSPLPDESERVRRRLRKIVEDLGITQTELAERAGLTQVQVCRILTGCSEMKVSTLVKLVEALELRMMFVPEAQLRAAREKQRQRYPLDRPAEDGPGRKAWAEAGGTLRDDSREGDG